MKDLSYDELIELITKEVVRIISENKAGIPAAAENADNRPKALLVGDCSLLPISLKEKFRLLSHEEYKGDISGFDAVILCSLSASQLADCALGRDSSPVPCCVVNAFLNGKDVYIIEAGLPHRKHKEHANRKFYAMLEGYVNSLRSYGAQLVREQWYGNNLAKSAIADNFADKLITESAAVKLCEQAQDGLVRLKCGTVITPSAKDVFNHSEIKVEFVD